MVYDSTDDGNFHSSEETDDPLGGMEDAIGFGEGGNEPFGGGQTEEITTHRDPDTGEFDDVEMGSVTVKRGENGEFEEADDDTSLLGGLF